MVIREEMESTRAAAAENQTASSPQALIAHERVQVLCEMSIAGKSYQGTTGIMIENR
jgi:hypothetical protein